MGMWGMGVFANDAAADFLDRVVEDFTRHISAALGLELRDDELVEVKPVKEVELADLDRIALPSATILIRLCEGPVGPIDAQSPQADDSRMPDPITDWSATPPAVSVIRTWRERALAAFVANVETSGASADYWEERPAVIRRAFDRLEAIAADRGL